VIFFQYFFVISLDSLIWAKSLLV